MKGIVMLVTLDMARQWLGSSPGNRRARPWWVKRLAMSMRHGQWMLSHQGIAIDEDGRLLDGHHRLEAMLVNGVPLEMFVITGCPRTSFEVLDQGLKRSISDLLMVDSRIAAALRLATQWVYARGGSVTPCEVRHVSESGLGDALTDIVAGCGTEAKVLSAAASKVAAGVLMLAGQDDIPASYRRLVTVDMEAMTPSEQALLRQVISGLATASDTVGLLARVLRAMDVHRPSVQKIQISADERARALELVRDVVRSRMGVQS